MREDCERAGPLGPLGALAPTIDWRYWSLIEHSTAAKHIEVCTGWQLLGGQDGDDGHLPAQRRSSRKFIDYKNSITTC